MCQPLWHIQAYLTILIYCSKVLASRACHDSASAVWTALCSTADSATQTKTRLTFRHRASSIQDRRFATLKRTLFIYLIKKYISLSDTCLTVHHWYKQYRQPTRCNNNGLLIIPVSSTCFGKLFCPSSGALDCVTVCGIMHPRCCRPATSWVHYTTHTHTHTHTQSWRWAK